MSAHPSGGNNPWPKWMRPRWLRPVAGVLFAVLLVLDAGLTPHPYFTFQTLPFFDLLFGIGVSLVTLGAAFVFYLILWREGVYDDD